MRGMATVLIAFAIVLALLAVPRAAEVARAEAIGKDERGSYSVAQVTGNAVVFVSDVTIPDGMVVNPGARFTKTWRLQNSGSASWNGYSLVFVHGNRMGAPASVSVPTTAPGVTVDISVPMTAPAEAGSHQGHWQMRAADGTSFGQAVFVLITVTANRTVDEVAADLGDHSPHVRREAVKGLIEFGATAAPTLVRVLKNDADAEVRVSAIGVLAGITPLPREGVRAILAAIGDPDPTVSTVATMMLAALTGPPPRFGPEVVPSLVDALTDPNPTVQQMTIQLLGSLGPAAREAIPALRELVARQPNNELAQGALRVIEGR